MSHSSSFLGRVVIVLFLTNMLFAIMLVRVSIAGLPVRLCLVFLLIATVTVLRPQTTLAAIRDQRNQMLLLTYLMICGLLSSALAGDNFSYAIGQIFQIHVQAIISVIAGYLVVEITGYKGAVVAFLIPVGLSAAFAFLQFAGFSPAWSAYDALSALQPRDLSQFEGFDPHYRALGLSYSPVHLGTQVCLAFAVLFAYRVSRVGKLTIFTKLDPYLVAVVVILGLVCVASGNRSPMLGLVVFLSIYTFLTKPKIAILGLLGAVAIVLLGDAIVDAMNASGLRTLNTENSSGEGRLVLSVFGLMLFFDQPFGYGLSFDSVAHYSAYWDALKDYPNAQAITMHALHNYYLMVLNKHGILAMFVLPYLLISFFRNPAGVLAFVPYMVHIFYHNDGPLQADFMFWFILPLVSQNPAFYPRRSIPSLLGHAVQRSYVR